MNKINQRGFISPTIVLLVVVVVAFGVFTYKRISSNNSNNANTSNEQSSTIEDEVVAVGDGTTDIDEKTEILSSQEVESTEPEIKQEVVTESPSTTIPEVKVATENDNQQTCAKGGPGSFIFYATDYKNYNGELGSEGGAVKGGSVNCGILRFIKEDPSSSLAYVDFEVNQKNFPSDVKLENGKTYTLCVEIMAYSANTFFTYYVPQVSDTTYGSNVKQSNEFLTYCRSFVYSSTNMNGYTGRDQVIRIEMSGIGAKGPYKADIRLVNLLVGLGDTR